MRIYLDSNVIISILKQELGRHFKPLYIDAEDFLTKTLKEKHELYISDLFLDEVEKITFTKKENIKNFLEETNNLIKYCNPPSKKTYLKVKNIGIHDSDAYHIACAIDNKCNLITTFNIKDFKKAEHLIKIIEPNEL